jgi:hypothetical protein
MTMCGFFCQWPPQTRPSLELAQKKNSMARKYLKMSPGRTESERQESTEDQFITGNPKSVIGKSKKKDQELQSLDANSEQLFDHLSKGDTSIES